MDDVAEHESAANAAISVADASESEHQSTADELHNDACRRHGIHKLQLRSLRCSRGAEPILDIDTAEALPHTLPMNIILSVEDQVAERARRSAAAMGETLEQAVEDYIRELAEKPVRVGVVPNRRTLREKIYRLG